MLLIKVGGGNDINWDYIAEDLATLSQSLIIIHGANYMMREISHKLGIVEKIITSPSGHISRYTDEKTMEVLLMAYSGLMNKKIVACIQKHGLNAVGLTGADGKLWLGKRKESILSKEGGKIKIVRDSATGNVVSVNVELFTLLVQKRYIPVITIPAITQSGDLINVDNDRAMAVMARDLGVKTIVMLLEAPGILRDLRDEATKISSISESQLNTYIDQFNGRIRKKLLGIKEALSFGVERVFLYDGRKRSPVTSALEGKGTLIERAYE